MSTEHPASKEKNQYGKPLSHIPKAGIIFDKFYIFKALNDAVNMVTQDGAQKDWTT